MGLRRFSLALPLACFALVATACSEAPRTNLTGYPASECQPLVDASECFLPFPSDFFRRPDPAMASGFRVRLTGAATVFDKAGRSTDMSAWRPLDGSSLTPMIVGRVGHDFSAANFVNLVDDPKPTVEGSSPILLVEADTGRLVPHYEDVDLEIEPPEQRTFIVSPLERLTPGTRYVVLVKGLVDGAGVRVAPAEGFRMLRDRVAANDDAVGPLAEAFERDVFPVAARVGVPRESLQLAWTFTTGSSANVTGDTKKAFSLLTAELEANPAVVRVTSVEEPASGTWGRKVYGTLSLPSVLSGTGDRWAQLERDEAGAPKLNGRLEVAFRALVPRTVWLGTGTARSLVFGHGFFGTAKEAEERAMAGIAEKSGSVVFALDWLGMSNDDIESVSTRIAREPEKLAAFTERTVQSLANIGLLRRTIAGPLGAVPELRRAGEASAIFDPDHVAYMGISQGHLLGGIALALDNGFDRAVLHVGGGAVGQIMLRSENFATFLALIGSRVQDALARRRVVALSVGYLDRIDPLAFADDLRVKRTAAEPGMPLLLQTGLGDSNVPHFAGMHHARALRLGLAKGGPMPVWGLAEVDLGTVTSAYQVFDRGWDPATYRACKPPTKTSPIHEALRLDSSAVNQAVTFLTTGELVAAP
jgi:hypothetical protein